MRLSSSCIRCFRALAAIPRFEIVNLLQKQGRASVLEITRHFVLRQPTITHHLQYLQQAGILSSQKEGRQVFYFLKPKCRPGKCPIFLKNGR